MNPFLIQIRIKTSNDQSKTNANVERSNHNHRKNSTWAVIIIPDFYNKYTQWMISWYNFKLFIEEYQYMKMHMDKRKKITGAAKGLDWVREKC